MKYKVKEARIETRPEDQVIAAAIADLVNHAIQHRELGARPVIARITTVLELVASERQEAVTRALDASRKRGGLSADV